MNARRSALTRSLWVEQGAWRAGLQPGHLGVVRVANRWPKAAVQLAAVEDDLLGMYRLDSIQWNTEVSCILHVYDQTVRRYLSDRAELLVPVGHEGLVPDFDRLSHDPPSLHKAPNPQSSSAFR